MNKIRNKILISLIAGLLAFVLSIFGLFDGLDHLLTDRLYQRPQTLNNKIKIIAIDEKSMDSLGAYDTWSRAYYAQLLNLLYADAENSPEICIFDLILQGNKDEEADHAFAEAAKNAGGIVCAANMVFKPAVETTENGEKFVNPLHVELTEYPYDELKQYAAVGFANTIQDDRDSFIREFCPTLSGENGDLAILGLAAARFLEQRGEVEVSLPDTKPGEKLLLKYSGLPGDVEVLSFSDVLEGKIPAQAFRGSYVFIGAYAPGMMDSFGVPITYSQQMYGVEIHANIFEAVTRGKYMVAEKAWIYSLIYALIVMLFVLIAQMVSLKISALIGCVSVAAGILCGTVLAGKGKFIPLLVFVVCMVVSYIGVIVYHYVSELLQRQRVLRAFKQYVAPQVVEEISKKGNFELKLEGQNKDIAVLFVDIRGFTSMSEKLPPEQVVKVLNEYLTLTTNSIFNNKGTLDKFVGDATMAVFNSPFDLDDYVYRAVCTARDIVAGGAEISKKAFEITGKEVGFGVGVNCGEAVVGNIGCDFRMDYTAIGDTVNTAARLEANAKSGQVLLSQMVVDRLGDRIKANPVGEIPLKGKSIPLMIYELVEIYE